MESARASRDRPAGDYPLARKTVKGFPPPLRFPPREQGTDLQITKPNAAPVRAVAVFWTW